MAPPKLAAFWPRSRRKLQPHEFRTLLLATLGGALEFYDFIIFVFFANQIGQGFFPAGIADWIRQIQTYGLFAVAYLARPIGGGIMAHFGDRLGRKQMFTLSILLMAVPTLLIGLLPSYHAIGPWAPLALLVCRILQGAAVGGEVPGAWVFVAEHVPSSRVGLACGTLTAGLTSGILLGSLVSMGINASFSQAAVAAYAWRIPFLIGGALGLLAAYVRRWLRETPVFDELRRRRALATELPVTLVLRNHLVAVIVSALLTCLLAGAIVVVILMTPPLLVQRFHVLPIVASEASCLATLGLTVGCILTGWLVDRFGFSPVLAVGSALLGVAVYAFYSGLRHEPGLVRPLYALAGFCVGIVAVVPCYMVQAFPALIRFSGLSLSYNIPYAIFGGLTPLLLTILLARDLMSPAYYVGLLSLVGIGLGLLHWIWRPKFLAHSPLQWRAKSL